MPRARDDGWYWNELVDAHQFASRLTLDDVKHVLGLPRDELLFYLELAAAECEGIEFFRIGPTGAALVGSLYHWVWRVYWRLLALCGRPIGFEMLHPKPPSTDVEPPDDFRVQWT